MALAECLNSSVSDASLRRPDVLFVRVPQAKALQRGLATIVLTALRESDSLVKQLIIAKSKNEFVSSRKRLFSDYANLSFIVANSFSVASAEHPMLRQMASKGGFKVVERILHEAGTPRLGPQTIKEAFFCLDTLRRAHRIVDELHARGDAPQDAKKKDRKLSFEFTRAALWAHLHLDCVRLLVTQQRSRVEKDVLDAIMDGARSAVMAYSYARQGLEMRTRQETYLLEGGSLDEEDRELLEESYSDYAESSSKVDAEA